MPLTRYDSALLNSRPHTMPTMLYTFIPEWHLPEPMSELTGVRNHSSFPLSAGYPQIRSPASRRLYHNFIPLSTCTIKDLSLSSGTTVRKLPGISVQRALKFPSQKIAHRRPATQHTTSFAISEIKLSNTAVSNSLGLTSIYRRQAPQSHLYSTQSYKHVAFRSSIALIVVGRMWLTK